VYELLKILTGDGTDPHVFVEQAKAATELHVAYSRGDRWPAAVAVIRDAERLLRSPEYLAARVRDLGQSAEEFLDSIDALLAANPPSGE
jgi:hypothetical protein